MVTAELKKGKRVEVLHEEKPLGGWRPAKIICGDSHTYSVQYVGCSVVERVPRETVRPCPRKVKGLTDWVTGDIVEAIYFNSWKIAQVSRVLSDKFYYVRFLGSLKVFFIHTSQLRIRQTWRDNKWVVLQKDSGKCKGRVLDRPSKGRKYKLTDDSLAENQIANLDHDYLKGYTDAGYKRCSKKRQSDASLTAEKCPRAQRKTRAIEKDGKHQQVVDRCPVRLLEKVDAVASPFGENYVHSSFTKRMAGCSTIARRGISEMANKECLRVQEHSDAESTSSSVGSCSANNTPNRSSHQNLTCHSHYLLNHFDDAETSHISERELSIANKETSYEEIHRHELHAYRLTLMAFYASGPISWAREALLTNLRLSLNISNVEHLLELRNLISSH